MQGLVPPLRDLEAHLVQQLFQNMWTHVLLEGATAHKLSGARSLKWTINPSREEEAVQRWVDALQAHPPPFPHPPLLNALESHKLQVAVFVAPS